MIALRSSILVVCGALTACVSSGEPVADRAPARTSEPLQAAAPTAVPAAPSDKTGDLVGTPIGAVLDPADRAALERATETALDRAPAGQALPWRNSKTGSYGTVMPGPVDRTAGRDCRDFHQVVVIAGQQAQSDAQACRADDGRWNRVR